MDWSSKLIDQYHALRLSQFIASKISFIQYFKICNSFFQLVNFADVFSALLFTLYSYKLVVLPIKCSIELPVLTLN